MSRAYYDDPSLTFQVAALAIIRERLKSITSLFRYQRQVEEELFSETRITQASTGELASIWKLLGDTIAADIKLARESAANSARR